VWPAWTEPEHLAGWRREVVAPQRLVLTWGNPGQAVPPQGVGQATITLADRGDRTLLVFGQIGSNTEEGHTNAENRWDQALERLLEYVAKEESP
jgi:uncharacterized protein YndB with AHSA1/START domain